MPTTPQTVRKATARRPGGRSARIRQAVFDATLGLLAEQGYPALTIEGVAAQAGVNKTTIYRNWPTKSALVLAAAEARSEALIVAVATGDAERDLIAFVTSVGDNIQSPLGNALVIATLNESHDPNVHQARREFWRHRFHAAKSLIRSSIRGGQKAARAEVETVLEQLVAPIHLRVFITGEPVDAALIRNTVRWVLGRAEATHP